MIDAVVLIPGHGARYDKETGLPVWDPGATHTHKGDPAKAHSPDVAIVEADSARLLAAWLASSVTHGRVIVCDAPPRLELGNRDHALRSYTRRCEMGIREMSRVHDNILVLHLHFNGSGGRYGAVIADHASPSCRELAGHFARAIKPWGGPCLSEVKVATELDFPNAKGLLNATWNAGRLYPQAKVNALVLEPAFVDTLHHATLFTDESIIALARALGKAIVEAGAK